MKDSAWGQVAGGTLLGLGVLWALHKRFRPHQMLASFMEQQRLESLLLRRPQRIVLIRHGESLGQVDPSVFTRIADNRVPITEKGWKQALECGKALKAIMGDEKVKFWVSPYRRSQMTLKGIMEAFDSSQVTSIIEEPRIREQDWGNFQNLEHISKCQEVRREFGIFYYRFPQGESGADVFDRVSTFLESLFRDFENNVGEYEYSNAVLVSHGITCRMFLMRFLRWEVSQFQRTWNLKNCQFIILEKQSDGRYQVLGNPLMEDEPAQDDFAIPPSHSP